MRFPAVSAGLTWATSLMTDRGRCVYVTASTPQHWVSRSTQLYSSYFLIYFSWLEFEFEWRFPFKIMSSISEIQQPLTQPIYYICLLLSLLQLFLLQVFVLLFHANSLGKANSLCRIIIIIILVTIKFFR